MVSKTRPSFPRKATAGPWVGALLTALLLVGCEGEGEDKPGKVERPKFHTVENEGIWTNMSSEHLPQIEVLNPLNIKVTVPLLPTLKPRHYVEVIVVMQGKKEVAKKKFKPGLIVAKAEFELPAAIGSENGQNYTVVAKCNLHDMWRAVVPDE